MWRKSGQHFAKLTRLVAADGCGYLSANDASKVGGRLIIPAGYNLRDDWEIEGFTVNGIKCLLLNALQTGKVLQLVAVYRLRSAHLTNELALGHTAHLRSSLQPARRKR
jgi:hypothetical protein